MKGDFTRFTHHPGKHYSRVLKQQGRVDLDADWNAADDIRAHLERTEAIDVIGRCGVPQNSNGFLIEVGAGGALTFTPGRLYVDGILAEHEGTAPIPLAGQPDLPDYELPTEPGVYLVYADVWERHVTALEDADIREVALGGPDTMTRLRTICQVKLAPIDDPDATDPLACRPFPGIVRTGRLEARAEEAIDDDNPCTVPAGAGYRGLENRLYRVEIHDDGRDEDGTVVRTPTFKWSRDNGAVVLPIAAGGIDGDEVTLAHLGPDDVLTVKVGNWVEVLGDATELGRRWGTLAQIAPDGIDKAERQLTLTDDVSVHGGEGHLKVRRWDHQGTDDVPLQDGAVPVQTGWYALEDGIEVRFEASGEYRTGDYWLIPARTREGDVLWPPPGEPEAETFQLPHGIDHHTCTLAMVERTDTGWGDPRDCRPLFPPLTEVDTGGCCIDVRPGDDVREAVARAVRAGGGRICLCTGTHTVDGPLLLLNVENITIAGQNPSTVLQLRGVDNQGRGGIVIDGSRRIALRSMVMLGENVPALVTVVEGANPENKEPTHTVTLADLALINPSFANEGPLRCAVRLTDTDDVLLHDCRLLAEVGLLTRFGRALPDIPTSSETPGGEQPEPEMHTIDFDDLSPDLPPQNAGTTIATGGADVAVLPFRFESGETGDGAVIVEAGAEGAGLRLRCRNAALGFNFVRDFGGPATDLSLHIENQQLLFNVEVNDELRVFSDFAAIDGDTIGGVTVDVESEELPNGGTRRVLSMTGEVRRMAVGGMLVAVDEVQFTIQPDLPLPEHVPLVYGDGARNVHLHRVQMRYTAFGIWAARADGWHLHDCDLRLHDLNRLDEVPLGDAEALAAALDVFADAASLDNAALAQAEGTAVKSFCWRNGTIADSTLEGRHGFDAFWCMDSSIHGCTVHAAERGLGAFWLHAADWRDNRITCLNGPAFTFVGSHRTRLTGNRMQGAQGLLRGILRDALVDLYRSMRETVRAYDRTPGDEPETLALWVLLEESLRIMGLSALLDAAQTIVDRTLELLQTLDLDDVEVPDALRDPLLYALATALHDELENLAAGEGTPLWARLSPLVPVIALTVADNEMTTSADTILIEQLLTFGGMRIEGNRLASENGQTVRVEAWPYAANAALVAYLLRLILRMLPEGIDALRGLLDADIPDEIDEEDQRAAFEALREAANGFLDMLEGLVARWQRGFEALTVTDYRIAGNTLHSLNTAVESNLFELAVLDNHITLRERPVSNDEVLELTAELARSESLEAVGTVAYAGDVASIDYTGYTLTEDEPTAELYLDDERTYYHRNVRYAGEIEERSSERARLAASENYHYLGWNDLGANVRGDAGRYHEAVAAGNAERARATYLALGHRLREAVNSYGIWTKGAGCRIAGNHVLVPDDLDEDTQARGGIRLQGDEKVNVVIVLLGVLGSVLPDLDPMLGVTETLIESNEILGGVGHGINILEMSGNQGDEPEGEGDEDILPFQALYDLKVRGNQIRGMAGAGLVIDPTTLAVNVDIENNLITLCSNRPGTAGFTDAKGGIIITNAVLCRLRGNQISRCGNLEEDVPGIGLTGIVGLTLNDNHLLRNGGVNDEFPGGGIRLLDVYGGVDVSDNELIYNTAYGIRWRSRFIGERAAHGGANEVLEHLFLLWHSYLGSVTDADLYLPQVRITGNLVRSTNPNSPWPEAFDLAAPAQRLLVEGNTCHTRSLQRAGRIQQLAFGLINGNFFDLPAEGDSSPPPLEVEGDRATRLIITSNQSTGSTPISVSGVPAGNIQKGFNQPNF